MREMFSEILVQAAKANPNLYLLTGDHGYALFDKLRQECPDRFINSGVAEQNMIGVAAGLSKLGFTPVIYGLSAFIPIRVLEQIKIDFCYENLPCILIGDGAGVVYSYLGSSHQSTEDIACLRAVPNIRILSPADKYELRACFELALMAKAPVYLRFGKSDLGDVHSQQPQVQWGKPISIKKGRSDLAIFATGSMVAPAVRLVAEHYKDACLYSIPFIKPMDVAEITEILKTKKNVVVIEEHSVFGGLGSAIAEIAAEMTGGPRVKRLGINDRFSEMCGSYQYLMKEHELDFESLSRELKSRLG